MAHHSRRFGARSLRRSSPTAYRPTYSTARRAVLLSIVAAAAFGRPVYASTWLPASGDWFNFLNWSSGIPDGINNADINNAGTAQINSGTATAFELYLGRGLGQTGLLALSGGTYSASNTEKIGFSGGGSFNQTGGINKPGIFYLGYNTGSTGVYNLSGAGILSANTNEYIGYSGLGTFSQTGGTHTIGTSGNLFLGNNVGATGAYSLSGTSILTVSSQEYIGQSGMGLFTQTGGTHTIGSILYVGYSSGSTGIYNLSGSAILTVNTEERIGVNGFGSFNQIGGTHTVNNTLYVGYIARGTYSLNTGGLAIHGIEYIGYGSSSSGTFNQTGGTHTVGTTLASQNLYLAYSSSTTGVYSLGGTGSLAVTGDESIAYNGVGIFNQTSGIHAVGASLYLTHNDGTGVYNLSGTGSVTVGGSEYIGNSGWGTFNQSGGTHAITGSLYLTATPFSIGIYNLSGPSSLTVNGPEYIGYNVTGGFGSFNQTGGSHSIGTTLANQNLYLGYNSGVGRYTLNGSGSLLTVNGSVFIGGTDTVEGGTGILNIQDGTFAIAGTLKLWNTIDTAIAMSGGLLSAATEFLGPNNNQFTPLFTQSGGTHTVTGSMNLALDAGSSTKYNLQGGALTVGALLIKSGGTFAQTGGTFNTSTLSQSGGAVSLGGPQSLYNIPTVSIATGTATLTGAAAKILVTSNLSITGTGRLDLTSNDLLYHSTAGSLTSTFATLKSYLTGTQIRSSSASGSTGLGLMKAADYLTLYGAGATFSGQALTVNDLVIKYAYLGDADFSGRIGIGDYALLEAGFFFGGFDGVTKVASWVNGDFTGDGKVNWQDFAIIDNTFLSQGGTLAGDLIERHTERFGAAYVSALSALGGGAGAVPEPGTLRILVVGVVGLLRRRR